MIQTSLLKRIPVPFSLLLYLTAISLAIGCSASHHATQSARLGEPAGVDRMLGLIEEPGPIAFEKIRAADWAIARSGLINLDHPRAKAAGLEDGEEPIGVFFYALTHPRFGTFIVDSGVESGFRDEGGNPRVSMLVESAMNTQSLVIHQTTAEWLATRSEKIAGVFLTHIHLDHIMGLPDLESGTPVYVGPGETGASAFLNLFTRGTIDRMLAKAGPLEEWGFENVPDGRFAGLLDIFGDGSVWAIHSPGHTPGSTAFLVRSTSGPKLLVGDSSHTRWGWENNVEPGTFTADHAANARSLAALRQLAEDFPRIEVHLGHQ